MKNLNTTCHVNLTQTLRKTGFACLLAASSTIALSACVPQPPSQARSSTQYNISSPLQAITIANINVKVDAKTSAPTLYRLNKNAKIKIFSDQGGWYRVQNVASPDKPLGWIPARSIQIQPSAELASGVPAVVTKDVRLRSGAGTSYKILTILNAKEKLTVTNAKGSWLQVKSTRHSGWIHKDFAMIHMDTPTTPKISSENTRPPADLFAAFFGEPSSHKQDTRKRAGTSTSSANANERNVDYKGYSAEFQPIKKALLSGQIEKGFELMHARDLENQSTDAQYEDNPDTASQTQKSTQITKPKTDTEFAADADILELMEHGSLLLDTGNKEKARKYLSYAEEKLNLQDDRSHAGDFGAAAVSGITSILGFGEAGEYNPEGFERVLLLDYKTISYLLEGDRRAFNVAQRAIDLQNAERAAFEAQMKEAKKETEAKIAENKDSDNLQGISTEASQIFDGFNEDGKKIALTVDSAYVNPFADYITGLVLEIDGYRDRDQMSSAKIAYEKASTLAPNIKFLKKAAADATARKIYKNQKIVHVIIADGLAPERKTLTYEIPLDHDSIPVKLPVYVQENNKVASIRVKIKGRSRSTKLEKLSDIEAIAMRHDMDTRPLQTANMVVNVIRSGAEKLVLDSFGTLGTMLSKAREDVSNPDMRSWMTLPASYNVNRLIVPNSATAIQVSTYDKNNKQLSTKVVKIAKKGPTIVYGRSLDHYLSLQHSDKTWASQ